MSCRTSNNTGILDNCTRLWQTESEQATPVDSIKNVVRSSMKVPEFDKHLKKARGHIGRNVVEITIKMKTIIRKLLMIKIIKLRLRNWDNSFVYFHLQTYLWYTLYFHCFKTFPNHNLLPKHSLLFTNLINLFYCQEHTYNRISDKYLFIKVSK